MLVITSLVILAVVVAAVLVLVGLGDSGGDSGWESVPRKVHEFDLLSGEEAVVRGILEANDRVLAIPKKGEPDMITEAEVDLIVSEGLREDYDFRNPGWTHRIQLNHSTVGPSFVANDQSYHVIVSFETAAWRTEDVLNKYLGQEVEILGKWDSYTDPLYPKLSITQFRPKLIRKAPNS
jgi:hypothetical protein